MHRRGVRRFELHVDAVIADFDRDLVPDIATTDDSYNNEVTVVTGRGDGTFAPARSFAGAISPRWLAVGDLDGDLLPDLVTANEWVSDITVMLHQMLR